MAYHYSNPKRESDPYALPDMPDIEVFEVTAATPVDECPLCGDPVEGEDPTLGGTLDQPLPRVYHARTHVGWYWQACFPGCLPDGDPFGPFESEQDALDDARDGLEDSDADESEDASFSLEEVADAIAEEHERLDVIFEHGQQWVVCGACGWQAAIQPTTGGGFVLETVTESDDSCGDREQDESADDEPGEEDYYLSADERSIYYCGRRIVGPVSIDAEPCPRDAVMRELAEYVKRDQYWPNVWAISDHGNPSLISVLECGCYFTEHDGDASKHSD